MRTARWTTVSWRWWRRDSTGVSLPVVPGCGEDPLPSPLAGRRWVLHGQRVRNGDGPQARGEIRLVVDPGALQVLLQPVQQSLGDHGSTVLAPFPVPQVDLPLLEVEILHPQLQRLQEAQAAAVQQSGDEAGRAIQALQDGPHLRWGQYDRQPLGSFCADQLVHPLQLALEDVGIEEEQGRQRLVLGTGADPPVGREG